MRGSVLFAQVLRTLATTALAATVLLGAACGSDDDIATTATDPVATDATSAPTSEAPVTDPELDTSELSPLPDVTVTAVPTVRGGRVLAVEVTITNDGADAVGLLDLDDATGGQDGDDYRLVHVRTRAVDGDDAPPQNDALLVPAGGSLTLERTVGELSPLPARITVCLEGDVLPGAAPVEDEETPTTRIGPRAEAAGVTCSPATPLPEA